MKHITLWALIYAVTLCPGSVAAEDSDPELAGYNAMFNHDYLHDIEIALPQEEWDGLIRDMTDYIDNKPITMPVGGGGTYRRATFIYKGPAGDQIIEDVGFRTKGRFNNTERLPQDAAGNFHRLHFKVKFNKAFDQEAGTPEYEERTDRRFCKMRELIFRLAIDPGNNWDTSQIRELYCYDLLHRAGINTSRTGSARLTITIDGVPHYYGVYTLIESIDKSFLTRRFGTDGNDGNLYKCVGGTAGMSTLQPLDANTGYWADQFYGDAEPIGIKDWKTYYFPTYDLTTNEDEADHRVLRDFIDNLNTLQGDAFKQYMDTHFEVERFLRYLAMNVLMGKWDDYWTMGNNYYLYFHNAGKIEFIPTDYDMALGGGIQFFYTPETGIYEWDNHQADWMAMMTPFSKRFYDRHFNYASPLVDRLLEVEEYRQIYEDAFVEFIAPENSLFVYSDYRERFNRLHTLYAPYMENCMHENERMLNEETTGNYFFGRTQSVIAELGLQESAYETTPADLSPPLGVSAGAGASDSVITVTWDPVPFADFYEVYCAAAAAGPYLRISDNATGTRYDDTGCGADEARYYKVRALNRAGLSSDLSAAAMGYTNDGTMLPPSGVSASDGRYSTMVRVTWDPVLNADTYSVCRSQEAGGDCEPLADFVTDTWYNDTSARSDTIYSYCVRACKDDGAQTDLSDEDTGFAGPQGFAAPEIVTARPVTSGTYLHTYDYGTESYTFLSNGVCLRTAYSPQNHDMGKGFFQGTWRYDDDGRALLIDTTATVALGLMEIHVVEVWDNAFTTDEGQTLHLLGLKKAQTDYERMTGTYTGSGNSITDITGFINITGELPNTGAVTLSDNGTRKDAFVRYGDETAAETTWSDADARLISFRGACYLYDGDNDFVYHKRTGRR